MKIHSGVQIYQRRGVFSHLPTSWDESCITNVETTPGVPSANSPWKNELDLQQDVGGSFLLENLPKQVTHDKFLSPGKTGLKKDTQEYTGMSEANIPLQILLQGYKSNFGWNHHHRQPWINLNTFLQGPVLPFHGFGSSRCLILPDPFTNYPAAPVAKAFPPGEIQTG